MRKFNFLFCLILCILFLTGGINASAQTNLLVNSGFESDLSVGWTNIMTGNSVINADLAFVNSGTNSLQLDPDPGACGRSQDITTGFTVGKTYVLKGYGRLNEAGGTGYVGVQAYDASNSQLVQQFIAFTGTSFVDGIVYITVPEGTVKLTVFAWFNETAKTFYVDDITLSESENLLLNPGFESDLSVGWVNIMNGNSVVNTDLAFVNSGTNSLQLDPDPGACGRSQDITTGFTVGKTYVLKGYGRLNEAGGTGYVGVQAYDISNTQLVQQYIAFTDTSFVEGIVDITVPEGAVKLTVFAWFNETAKTFYVDDITLREKNNLNVNIVLALNSANLDGESVQYSWLIANGFNVTKLDVSAEGVNLKVLTQEQTDALNAADLVIIGRSINTNFYSGTGEDEIDSITAPVISNNPYAAKWAAPPMWFKNASMIEFSGTVKVKVENDPIFANSNVEGDSAVLYDKGCAFIVTDGTHNGTVISSKSGIGIVRFGANVPYNDDVAAKTPKSVRTIFPMGFDPDNFSLNHNGQAAYYGEIRRLVGLTIDAPFAYYDRPSSVATLASITTTVGTLDPVFAPETFEYSLVVPGETTSITLTATAEDAKATVEGNGVITFTKDTVVSIIVTAEDGATALEYLISIQKGTGINTFLSAGLNIYPNPAREYIKVDGLSVGARIIIINAAGQVNAKYVANSDKMEITLSNLKTGLYLMKVEIDGKSYSSRFIKQ